MYMTYFFHYTMKKIIFSMTLQLAIIFLVVLKHVGRQITMCMAVFTVSSVNRHIFIFMNHFGVQKLESNARVTL